MSTANPIESAAAQRQAEVLDTLGLANKELGAMLGFTTQHAGKYRAGEVLLEVHQLQTILRAASGMTSQARESLATLALDGSGIVPVDLSGREEEAASIGESSSRVLHDLGDIVARVHETGVLTRQSNIQVQKDIQDAIATLLALSNHYRTKLERKQAKPVRLSSAA